MAQITEHMSYTIWFTDEAEYQFALGAAENMQIKLSPRNAAALFGIPYPGPPSNPQEASKGMVFYFPFIPESSVNVTLAESNPIALTTFTNNILVETTAGVPANIWPKGADILLQWVGLITKAAPVTEGEDIPVIPQRRWVTGFEWVARQELAGVQGQEIQFSRVGSRTIDGFGFSYRGNSSLTCDHLTSDFRTFGATQPQQSWERLYVRFRNPGSANFIFWAARGNAEPGCHLSLNGLNIEAYNRTGVSTATLEGSFPIVLNTWYRFDFILQMRTGMGTTGIFQLYLDGALVVSFTKTDGSGINSASFHQRSGIGNINNVTNHEIEIDFDDWTNQDWPVNGIGDLSLESPDWFVGSHAYKHRSVSVITSWIGNTEAVNQGDSPLNNVPTTLTSTVSGAQIEGLTDLGNIETLNQQNTTGISFGQISAIVGQISVKSTSTNGRLGYRIAGAAAVLTSIIEQVAQLSNAVAYLPSGLILPVEITPFSVVREKSLNTSLVTQNSLISISENLGIWGPEDSDGTIDVEDWPNRFMLHNCRYGNTGWGNIGSIPLSPVIAKGGTYTGNGTIQSISLPAPCHFLWITNTTTGEGVRAFGSGIAGCTNDTAIVNSGLRIWADVTGQFFFTVHGNNTNLNQNAITYQYIAFCDPGMRFNLCGAYLHSSTGIQPKSNVLVSENFLAQAAFIQRECVLSTDTGIGLSYGLGGVGTRLGGVVLNPWVDFAPGIVNTYNNVHDVASSQFNYSLWRTNEDCVGVMCQIFSYVGDGTGSRVINRSPLSGRFPLFAMVVPRTGVVGAFRTPFETGSNSIRNNGTGGIFSTGITAGGIDTITVGTTLNTNGITYDCFIIPGSDTAWENGTFIANYCLPPLGPWEPPADPIGNIIIMSEGGLSLGATIPITILKDISGIYTLVPGKTNDTLIDRNATPVTDMIVKIPNPEFKTGYIGG